ncbi:hypothetical protein FJZ31_21520 [Candidatus Poribacteria bacterium]|nr:hypothetical protein [Candidatus Poribacteria bacterium]
MQSLNGQWLLATDPQNVGKEKRWFEGGPIAGAQDSTVPGIIQQTFPGYHGVVWYWRTLTPTSPLTPLLKLEERGIGGEKERGRYLLRFWAVDYLTDVWLNGIYVGGHEGGETPFVLDVTNAIKLGTENLLALRVLNPTNEPINGITLKQTPHRNKVVPYVTGGSYNHGGIMQSVELLYVPPVRISDIFARPEVDSGIIRLQAKVRNDTGAVARGSLTMSVAHAAGGNAIETVSLKNDCAPGDSFHEMEMRIAEPRLWSVDDPYLYRVTVHLRVEDTEAVTWDDEQSVRCGFRDFCFRDGYFRLNGRRIFLRSAHTGNHYPIGQQLPHDPELLRRDLYYAKTMGFNMVRFIAGVAYPSQLDFCDELGLLVYEESYAGWCLEDSPQMAERFDKSTTEMIMRDRNHPSLVIWGLLNETPDDPVFRHAVEALQLVRKLDDTRMVLLNSGRWDRKWSIGSISNPGSTVWEHLLGAEEKDAPDGQWKTGGYVEDAGDAHYYPPIPLSADSIRFFRTLGEKTKPVFLSEHGNGSEVDAIRVIRLYEQTGAPENLEDYQQYRSEAEKYSTDWERFGLDAVFASPGDLLLQSQRVQAEQRLVGLNAIRSNPNLCGYSLTGLCDQGMTAEGLWTTFRELKPGMTDAIRDGWEPLRWCIFVEPVNGYSGQPFKLEAVLANEDVLRPGEYPVRLKVVGPDGTVLDRSIILHVPNPKSRPEPPMVLPVFSEVVKIDGPAGKYDIVAYFEHGAAPIGGRSHFFVSEPASLPSVDTEVTVWGDEERLETWLKNRGISCHRLVDPAPQAREVILVGGLSGAPGDLDAFRELVRRIVQGSTAIFLTPKAFKRGDKLLGWLPLAKKGSLRWTQGWAAGRDDFAKAHPIFDGLPSKGLLEPIFYRDLIPGETYDGQDMPVELVAGAFAVGSYQPGGYYSGMHIAVYPLGAGRFILNTLLLIENLGQHPAADRLVLNFLCYAATNTDKPLAPLPVNFEEQLRAME